MRFTLPKLLLAVALAGLACAGMVQRTDLWAAGIVTLTLALFVAVALRAFGMRQRAQASASAFAAVGILYMMFVMCAQDIGQKALITNYPLAVVARCMLIKTAAVNDTTVLTDFIDVPGPIQPDDSLSRIIFKASATDATEGLGRFFLIGHCIWAWLIAVIAGATAGHMYATCQAKPIR
jgi:hypothetical protein